MSNEQWPAVPPQLWAEPETFTPEQIAANEESQFIDYVPEMALAGLSVSFVGNVATVRGTFAEWLAFLRNLDETS